MTLAAAGGWQLLSAYAQVAEGSGNGTLPGMRFGVGPQITPAAAQTHYAGLPATATYAWGTERPVEITETAAALENDPAKIFGFVKNYVRYEPRFGAQKGALGALIDRSGTAFDQAQLLVELLRAAGYPSARYAVGTVSLTGQQFVDWVGISDPAAARQFLADGGIPATVTGSTSISNVTMGHAWVLVEIDGVTVTLDPSYKKSQRWSQIDVATEAQLTPSSFVSTATNATGSGTENGVTYVTGVNISGAETELTAAAQRLLTKLKTTYRDKSAEEIVGGAKIVPYADPWAAKTTGTLSATMGTYTGGLPNKFRTKLDASSGTCAISVWVDEVYGRRLTFHSANVYEIGPPRNVLSEGRAGFSISEKPMPGSTEAASSDCGSGKPPGFTIAVDLPYAGADSSGVAGKYMDRSSRKDFDAGADIVVVHGWGDTSAELQTRLGADSWLEADVYRPTAGGTGISDPEYAGPPRSAPATQGQKQKAKLYASWLAQMARAVGLVEGAAKVRVQHHYTIGIAYTQIQRQAHDQNDNLIHDAGEPIIGGSNIDESVRLDLDSGFSTTSLSGSTTDRLAARHTIAALGAMLEGSVFEQQMDAVDVTSAAQRMTWAQENLGGTIRFHRFTPSTAGATVQERRNGQISSRGATCKGKAFATHYTVVQANDRLLGPGAADIPYNSITDDGLWPYAQRVPQSDDSMHRGCSWIGFNADGSEIAHVVTSVDRELKGAGAGAGKEAMTTRPEKQADLLKDEFKDRSNIEGVDLRTGAYTYRPGPDLVVGQGEFPYALSFQRVYQSGGQTCPYCVPGWTHNLDISAATSGGGLEGLGAGNPLALARPLVAVKAAFELYKADAGNVRHQLAGEAVMRWLSKHFAFNVVTVNQGASSETFVRLADDTWAAPPGSQSTLTQTGSRRRDVRKANNGRDDIWKYDQVAFTRKSGAGDQIAFQWREYNPDGYRGDKTTYGTLEGYAQGFFAQTWTFPQGVTLTFSYCETAAEVIGPPGPQVTSAHAKPCASRLERVENNLGLRLDIDLLSASTPDGRSTTASYVQNSGPSYPDFWRQVGGEPDVVANSFTDAAGQVWTYEWEWPAATDRPYAHPRLKRVKRPGAQTADIELAYDRLGRVKTVRDGESLAQNDPTRISRYYPAGFGYGARKDALGGFVRIVYDTDDRPVRQTDEEMRSAKTEYDAHGRVAKRTMVGTDGVELDSFEFAYDDRHNVVRKTHKPAPGSTGDPAIVIEAVYHPTLNKPTQVVMPATTADPVTRAYDYTYDSRGLLTKVEAPEVLDGRTDTLVRPTWTLGYDSYGRVTREEDPTGIVTTHAYGENGEAVWCKTSTTASAQLVGGLNLKTWSGCDIRGDVDFVTDPRGAAAGDPAYTTTTTYDVLRRKRETVGPAGTNIRTEWVYDAVGQVLQEKKWDATAGLWRTTTNTWSATGKLLTVTDPSGDVTRTIYDALDRADVVVDPETRATVTRYNKAGDVVKVERWWRADPNYAGRLLYAALPPGQTSHVWREHVYDEAGRLKYEIDGNGNRTQHVYDGLGRKKATIYPDPDGEGTGAPATEEWFKLDERGQLAMKKHRSGHWTQYLYDAAGRVTHYREHADGEAWPKGRMVRTSYDPAGRVVWRDVSDQTATSGQPDPALLKDVRTYGYDAAGRLVQDWTYPEHGTQPGFSRRFEYGYDKAGNRTSIKWPDDWTASYAYDPAGRMTTVSFPGGSATYAWNSLSQHTGLTRSNGTSTAWLWEPDGDLDQLNHAFAATSIPTAGNFDLASDKVGKINFVSTGAAFEWVPPGPGHPEGDYSRTYGVVNKLNQIDSETREGVERKMEFDSNGNMTTDGINVYEYDAGNRLLSAKKPGISPFAFYRYDGEERRTMKTAYGVMTRMLWSGQEELAETDAAGTILRRIVPGAGVDERIAIVPTAGAIEWHYTNHQNSVVAAANGAGNVIRSAQYSPHGELGAGAGGTPAGSPFGYTGRYFDTETGLYYYRARYYHPRLGQFMQVDPIGTKDDPNLYLYVANDPVNNIDPSGLDACPAGDRNCIDHPETERPGDHPENGYPVTEEAAQVDELVVTAYRVKKLGEDRIDMNIPYPAEQYARIDGIVITPVDAKRERKYVCTDGSEGASNVLDPNSFEGADAALHTHPNWAGPGPGADDGVIPARLGLSNYGISSTGAWVVELTPAGYRARLLAGSWGASRGSVENTVANYNRSSGRGNSKKSCKYIG